MFHAIVDRVQILILIMLLQQICKSQLLILVNSNRCTTGIFVRKRRRNSDARETYRPPEALVGALLDLCSFTHCWLVGEQDDISEKSNEENLQARKTIYTTISLGSKANIYDTVVCCHESEFNAEDWVSFD